MRRKNEPARVLCYAVNGLGLGHLTRLIAICRQLRRLCAAMEEPVEILFLTSSEGDGLALMHGFASFKIPSKTLASECKLDPKRYRKIAKQWVWNAVNLISPDLLLVDTFPTGSLGELPAVLDLSGKNVFVYRAVRPDAAKKPAFQDALRAYDRVILPVEAGESDSPMPQAVEARSATVAPILLRSSDEMLPRDDARATLGIPDDSLPLVYVSTGGGGDSDAEIFFSDMARIARALPKFRFVFGAGLLYRGREFAAPNVLWTRRPALAECFPAFDAAITAGGFNSVWELMHAGIPCAFLPRARGLDDQGARVGKCVDAGAGVLLDSVTAESVECALALLLDPTTLAQTRENARALIPVSGALDAAAEALSVCFPRESLDDALLLVDTPALVDAARAGVSEDALLTAAAILWRRSNLPRDGAGADDARDAARAFLEIPAVRALPERSALNALRQVLTDDVSPDCDALVAAAIARSQE